MAYRHTNSKGVAYYLNAKETTLRGGKAQTIYYFSKDERTDTGVDLPGGRTVNENPNNGFLSLKLKGAPLPTGTVGIAPAPPEEVELSLNIAADTVGLAYLDDSEPQHVQAPNGDVYQVSPVYVASLFGSEGCVERLERLIRGGSSEPALQECLEQCPELVRIFGHKDALPHVVLEAEGQRLIPDFVLRPVFQDDLCDLLEIKKPSLNVLAGSERRPRLAYQLAQAIKQLHDYAEALDDPAVRTRVAEHYHLDFFRPRLYLIAGRAGDIDRVRLKRALYPDDRTEIVSWDEVIARAHDRHT